ncbi:MAG: hypothetical protein HYT75_01685 [Deltaproteobacteria bacterium]|nr:hypothetical protein [Deltaproteobacteria bacterium]
MKKTLFLLFAGLLFQQSALADEAKAEKDPLSYESRAAWTTRNEFFVFAGDYHGDSFENSLLAGGEYIFHFTKHIGAGATFVYSKADYKENIYYSQAGFFTNDNVYAMDATGMISFPSAYRIGKHTIEADLYVLLGGGTININSSYEPHGFIGGGMKIYAFKPWFAIRAEMRDTFHTTNKPGGVNEFDQDLLFNAGLSFQAPPKLALTR